MIGIVAANHERIRSIVRELGLDRADVAAIPTQTIYTAARGLTLDALLVDDTAVGADLCDVMPALFASGGSVYTLTRSA